MAIARSQIMNNFKSFDSWLTTDTEYDANELAQCVIDDRINELTGGLSGMRNLIQTGQFQSENIFVKIPDATDIALHNINFSKGFLSNFFAKFINFFIKKLLPLCGES
jgi:hypothetical protein